MVIHLHLFVVLSILHISIQMDFDLEQMLEVKQTKHLKVEPGGSVTVNCTFNSDSKSYTVFWSLGCENNKSLENNPCFKHRVQLKNLNKQITIFNIAESDSAIYCCHVELSRGIKGTGSGTRVEVIKRKCDTECDSTINTLSISMEILRISSLIILIILVSILLKKSAKNS